MAEPRTLTPLAVAALALLAERPSHPYEMYQTLVQRSEDRLVKVRPGSLYHTVDRLEAHGFVRATGRVVCVWVAPATPSATGMTAAGGVTVGKAQ